tara:strand:- start:88 stop:402 length:315 start_codon:yes stop_codon:yes gene_type:complete
MTKQVKHKMAPMTQAELLKRIKSKQNGVWKGYEYEAEWWNDGWLIDDACGPRYDTKWYFTLDKHLNRFYDNESNPGPAYQKACDDWTRESKEFNEAYWANKATA